MFVPDFTDSLCSVDGGIQIGRLAALVFTNESLMIQPVRSEEDDLGLDQNLAQRMAAMGLRGQSSLGK